MATSIVTPDTFYFRISKPAGKFEVLKGYFWEIETKPSIWHRFWVRVFFR